MILDISMVYKQMIQPQDIQHTFTTLTVNLPTAYGYVLLAALVIALEILVFGFAFPGRYRTNIFGKQYLKKHFGIEHTINIGQDIQTGGYPDMGSGRYSQQLTYQEWYQFNNAQRAHYNLIEMAPSIFVFLLIAGFYFPLLAAAVGFTLAIFRGVYSINYMRKGPRGREIGAVGNAYSLIVLLILSLASCVKFALGNTE